MRRHTKNSTRVRGRSRFPRRLHTSGPEVTDAAAAATAAIINLALMRHDRLFMGRCTAASPVVHDGRRSPSRRLLCII